MEAAPPPPGMPAAGMDPAAAPPAGLSNNNVNEDSGALPPRSARALLSSRAPLKRLHKGWEQGALRTFAHHAARICWGSANSSTHIQKSAWLYLVMTPNSPAAGVRGVHSPDAAPSTEATGRAASAGDVGPVPPPSFGSGTQCMMPSDADPPIDWEVSLYALLMLDHCAVCVASRRVIAGMRAQLASVALMCR